MKKVVGIMFGVQSYFANARENEEIFRNVLRDLRDNRVNRPMGVYVPEDLETEGSLDQIFQECSEGNRSGRFTITSFSVLEESKATIGFQNIAFLSGGAAELEYLVEDNNSVIYEKPVFVAKS